MADIQSILGYHFRDQQLLALALTSSRTAARRVFGNRVVENNKRLALLGDKVLGLLLVERYYQSGWDTETIDRQQQSVACNENLHHVGMHKGISWYIHRNPGDTGAVARRTMADTMEALIGAAYLDGGLDAARIVVIQLGLERL